MYIAEAETTVDPELQSQRESRIESWENPMTPEYNASEYYESEYNATKQYTTEASGQMDSSEVLIMIFFALLAIAFTIFGIYTMIQHWNYRQDLKEYTKKQLRNSRHSYDPDGRSSESSTPGRYLDGGGGDGGF